MRGERDRYPAVVLRRWKVALLVSKVRRSFLEMHRNRVMDPRIDFILLQVSEQLVATFHTHDVEMIHVLYVRRSGWNLDELRQVGQPHIQSFGIGYFLASDELGLRDQPVAHHGLKRVEPRVVAEKLD